MREAISDEWLSKLIGDTQGLNKRLLKSSKEPKECRRKLDRDLVDNGDDSWWIGDKTVPLQSKASPAIYDL